MEGEKVREELMWDKVRTLAATMYNSSGNAKKLVKPSDIMTLDLDKKKPKVPIPSPKELIDAWQHKQHGLKSR